MILHHINEGDLVTHHFNQIATFINNVIFLQNPIVVNGETENHQISVKVIFDSLKDTLEQKIFEQENSESLTLLIQYIQLRLTNLADSLPANVLEVSEAVDEIYVNILLVVREIHARILELLHYLHFSFGSYFNLKFNLPICFYSSTVQLISGQDKIINNLLARGVDSQLVAIIGDFINSLAQPNNFFIKTWEQFDYLNEFVFQLKQFCKVDFFENCTVRLLLLLIGQNFNCIYFYNFLLDFIDKTILGDNIYQEQEIGLIEMLRIIANVRQEVKTGYNPDIPFIGESVVASIKRDLERIDSLKRIYNQDTGNTGEGGKDFYFKLAGTVEELMFIIKILMDLKILKTKFKSIIYTFIEKHIKTERTKTPSTQYMRNILSPNREVPTRIVKRIRSTLMSIVHYIDINYKDHLKFCIMVALTFPTDVTDLFF